MKFEIEKSIPKDFQIMTIKEICTRITSGGTPRRNNPDFYKNGLWSWVKTQELQDSWIEHTEENITLSAIENSAAKILPRNTVLMAMYGATVGQLGILKKDMTCNQACCALIVDEKKVVPIYLFYILKLLRPEIKLLATGAAQQNLSVTQISQFRLPFPKLEEQRAIAHILGTLDDKIELNRRMNETLEAMAQALFKSWFVDFDPVRAKMEGRTTGLPKEIEDLFPDSFEDSELGEIPRGWEVKSVEDCISRLPVGRKYEQKTVSPIGRIPVLDQGKSGIIGYHDHAPSLNASIDKPIAVFANHTCYMRLVYFPFSVIQNVLPFVGNDLETIWVFYATYNIQSFIEYKGHWPDFVIKKIVVPNIFLTREFSRMVHPLLKTTWANECESNTLIAIRDTLLPKILSGDLGIIGMRGFIAGFIISKPGFDI